MSDKKLTIEEIARLPIEGHKRFLKAGYLTELDSYGLSDNLCQMTYLDTQIKACKELIEEYRLDMVAKGIYDEDGNLRGQK